VFEGEGHNVKVRSHGKKNSSATAGTADMVEKQIWVGNSE